uniref:LigA n=1 Tax=Parastrongyloides trichosuri TaxID=131310 RepID=A0A0N4ZD69_PARTI
MFRRGLRLETRRQADRGALTQIVLVDADLVALLLILLEVRPQQVAQLQGEAQVAALHGEVLAIDEVEEGARLLHIVRLARRADARAARGDPLRDIVQDEGRLRAGRVVFPTQLQVGDVLRLALQTAAVLDEEGRLFRTAAATQGDNGVAVADRNLRVRPGVVGLHQPALVGDEGRLIGELEVFLHLGLDAHDGRFRRVEEGLLALVADVDDHRFDRLVQLLVEDARRDELLAAEIPFPARVQVQDLGVRQIRVADEDAIAFRVGIGLGRQFAELRTADGLGRAEAQLLILGEVPRRGERRQPVLLLDLGRLIGRGSAEQVARRHALLAVLEADAEGGADGRHELGVDHGVDRIDLHVGVIGVGAVRAGDLAQLQGPRIDVEVREQIVDPRATLAVGQAVDGLELQAAPPTAVQRPHAAAGVEVRPGRSAGALGRGADVEVGPLHLMIVVRQRQPAQEVQTHVVLVGLDVEGRDRHQVVALELALFLDRLTGAPGVVVTGHGDDAQVADLGRGAETARQLQAAVDRRLLTLHQTQRRIDHRAAHPLQLGGREVGHVDLLAGAEGQVDRPRNLAGLVVEAGPVGVRAVIDQVVAARRLGVATDARLEGQEGLSRGVHGAQVDDPAAELAR